jgi:Family of unknown function (DUF5926)
VSKRRKSSRPDSAARPKVRDVFVPRPFEGLASEPDWVALRELVPAATAPLRLAPELAEKFGEREITLATVLPLAWPALTKPDGRIFLGLQRSTQSGDVSRDLAFALMIALEVEGGGPVVITGMPSGGPRLQDMLADGPLEVTMRDGFDFWLDEGPNTPDVQASLERANASVFPTVKLDSVEAGYWCRFPERAHIRWVLPDHEDAALAALARLGAAGELTLGEGTKFAGMFRAHGLLVPVWDLPHSVEAAEWEEPMIAFSQRYATSLAAGTDLNAEERRSRAGLVGRQLTLR